MLALVLIPMVLGARSLGSIRMASVLVDCSDGSFSCRTSYDESPTNRRRFVLSRAGYSMLPSCEWRQHGMLSRRHILLSPAQFWSRGIVMLSVRGVGLLPKGVLSPWTGVCMRHWHRILHPVHLTLNSGLWLNERSGKLAVAQTFVVRSRSLTVWSEGVRRLSKNTTLFDSVSISMYGVYLDITLALKTRCTNGFLARLSLNSFVAFRRES